METRLSNNRVSCPQTARRLATLLISGIAALSIGNAKPYPPFPINQHQSDGTTLTIEQIGDEHYHYTQSTDGYLLVDSVGVYYYANAAAENSGMKAHNRGERNQTETKYLQTLDPAATKTLYRTKTGFRSFGHAPKPALRAGDASGKPVPSDLTKGEKRIIVVPVQSPSIKLTFAKSDFSAQLNEKGYSKNGNYGSVRDYYIRQSKGAFTPNYDVYDPVTLSKDYGSLTDDEIIKEALDGINISDINQYDTNNDGYIDGLIIILAGTANQNSDHGTYMGYNNTQQKSGKTVATYILCSELSGLNNNYMDGVGTIIHEFGHMLGLTDHYTVRATDQRTPKYWDVMDYGCYNGSTDNVNGTHVPNMSAFELQSLGWLTPTELTADSIGAYSLPVLREGKAYAIETSRSGEWFLIENRQKEGWDEELPGHGMLIWHINYDKQTWDNDAANDTANRQHVDLVEAAINGTDYYSNLDYYSYPGTANVTSFSNFTDWEGVNWGVKLYNITEKDSFICFSTSADIAISKCPCEATTAPTKTVVSDTATLTKHGVGKSSQTVTKGNAISEFNYVWTNADNVEVNGLPTGITATIDATNKKVTISGTANDAAGTYTYTISTTGSNVNISKTGTITITENTGIQCTNSDNVEVMRVEYYDLTGRQLNENAKGLMIMKETLKNGEIRYEKAIRK
jgi:immune inhibitor A